jgi:ABC-type antimicrobial peptide transport system permease subunit
LEVLATAMLAQKSGLPPESHDAATIAAAILVILTAALTATYLPARRAMRVDPIVARRGE